MTIDRIAELCDEAIVSLENKQSAKVWGLLHELRGMATALYSVQEAWGLIRDDYTKGIPPRVLANRYHWANITAAQIHDKAYKEQWPTPKRIKKAMKAALPKANTAKKSTYLVPCLQCQQSFVAQSGHAKICPTCQGWELQRTAGLLEG